LAAGRVDDASLSRQNPDMFDSAFPLIRQIPSQSGPQNDFLRIAHMNAEKDRRKSRKTGTSSAGNNLTLLGLVKTLNVKSSNYEHSRNQSTVALYHGGVCG